MPITTPQPQRQCVNYLCDVTNSPNCKDYQFAVTENRCKQEIAAFEKLDRVKAQRTGLVNLTRVYEEFSVPLHI